jgi:hypothetical protein
MEFSGTLARKSLKIRTIRANVRRSKHNYHALAPDFALREPFSRSSGRRWREAPDEGRRNSHLTPTLSQLRERGGSKHNRRGLSEMSADSVISKMLLIAYIII